MRIQIRRDSDVAWYNVNPILLSGEIGLDTTANKFKIGDGETAWNDLSYSTSSGAILYGTSDPIDSVGFNNDFYLNTTSLVLFGPKEEGTWGIEGTQTSTIYSDQIPEVNSTDGPYELGLQIQALCDITITKIRFFKPLGDGSYSPRKGKIWNNVHSKIVEVEFGTETDSGWQEVSLDTPLEVSSGTTLTISYNTGTHYNHSPASDIPIRKQIRLLNSLFGTTNHYPTNSWNSAYFIDIEYEFEGLSGVDLSPRLDPIAFKTISVSGQNNIVADSPEDTLTLVAGTNISITTNKDTDSITITGTTIYSIKNVIFSDSPYTIVPDVYNLYFVDTSDGAISVVLPEIGSRVVVKWDNGLDENSVSISVQNSGTVDGFTSYVLSHIKESITLINTSSGVWKII